VRTDFSAVSTGWDARAYERVSEPQFEWGQRVLARLPLSGDEAVVDAGCGVGRLTELLAERLPRGRVVALDSSQAMLDQARLRLARFGDRVSFVLADVAKHVEHPPVAAVFSTATFHWVLDHDTLFASIAASLRPGGLLVSQSGGGANLSHFRERAASLREDPVFAPFFQGFTHPAHYAMPDETTARLERAGFVEVRAWLEAAPVRFPDAGGYAEYATKVLLRDELARLPDDALRAEYVRRLVELASGEDPPFELDYWRLNADAARG
jgi:trans-aconitate methyltransferase